jgi:hypothetical protein
MKYFFETEINIRNNKQLKFDSNASNIKVPYWKEPKQHFEGSRPLYLAIVVDMNKLQSLEFFVLICIMVMC